VCTYLIYSHAKFQRGHLVGYQLPPCLRRGSMWLVASAKRSLPQLRHAQGLPQACSAIWPPHLGQMCGGRISRHSCGLVWAAAGDKHTQFFSKLVYGFSKRGCMIVPNPGVHYIFSLSGILLESWFSPLAVLLICLH
jgi:hypothetical protein